MAAVRDSSGPPVNRGEFQKLLHSNSEPVLDMLGHTNSSCSGRSTPNLKTLTTVKSEEIDDSRAQSDSGEGNSESASFLDGSTELGDEATPAGGPDQEGSGGSSSERHQSKALKRGRDTKVCQVCGDKALGHNFGAITCESCKAFFRRNALKPEIPPCIFQNECKIDVPTRRFCTACRLKKCCDVNMKKELILGEEDRRRRQSKVAENRAKRRRVQDQVVTKVFHKRGSQSPPSTPSTPALPKSTESLVTLDLTSLTKGVMAGVPLEILASNGVVASSSSACAVSSAPVILMAGPSPGPSVSELSTSHLYELSSLELSGLNGAGSSSPHYPCPSKESAGENTWMEDVNVILPSNYPDSMPTFPSGDVHDQVSLNEDLSKEGHARLLTRDQWVAINDLRQAYDMSFINTLSDRAPEGNFTLSNLVNTSEFIVRKLINFAKKLSDFSILSQDCQIGLLKGVVINTLFLRSANHYDVEKDVWITPNGEIPTRILQIATGLNVLYEEHAKYCRSFRALVGEDSPLIALMQVLCLFSPDRLTIRDRQLVSNVHDRYILLLKHYLEARYGFQEARAMLSAVLNNLTELQRLTDSHGKVLLQVDPNKVDPLMLEVFNLNDNTVLNYQGASVLYLEKATAKEKQPATTFVSAAPIFTPTSQQKSGFNFSS